MVAVMREVLYPLQFEPVYKDYIWGGRKIGDRFNRDSVPDCCAESWEIADRDDGMSVVANGSLAGKTLRQLMQEMPEDLLGTSGHGEFPLLVKIIDAAAPLSIQVHPDDNSSEKYGGEAKTEMWYLLDADEDACIYAGTVAGVTPDRFRAALEADDLEPLLQRTAVEQGDIIYVPGGRVHAIGAGCFLLEVQQNSNTTYRVYDWGRMGHDGKPRELHIDKAFEVINWDDETPQKMSSIPLDDSRSIQSWEVLRCPYFVMQRFMLNGTATISETCEYCHILFGLRGTARISTNNGDAVIVPGSSTLIPASLRNYDVVSDGMELEIIKVVPLPPQ
jgi:mannose-6-phosphate isomerase